VSRRGRIRSVVALVAAAAMFAAALAGASGLPPTVTGLTVTDAGWSVGRVVARASGAGDPVLEMEYRLPYAGPGPEGSRLFAVDGFYDSPEEDGELWIDLTGWGAPPWTVEARARNRHGWGAWAAFEVGPSAPHLSWATDAPATCRAESAQAGKFGWHRGPATVNCAALAARDGVERLEYAIGFGDWRPMEGPLRVAEEGSHWVQVRGVDRSGGTTIPEVLTVGIDRTPPVIRVFPPERSSFSRADRLLVLYQADDLLSGVESVVALVNDDWEIPSGHPVPLWQVPTGQHTISVRARDMAGNRAVSGRPILIQVYTDIPTLRHLVTLFAGEGRLDGSHWLAAEMRELLMEAWAAQQIGDRFAVRRHLSAFSETVQEAEGAGAIFPEAARVLVADARSLLAEQEFRLDFLEERPG
jgi:hypothetical protein